MLSPICPLAVHETSIDYLLIQRRNSIGFIEMIRCKFKPGDIAYMKEQLEGTTMKERTMLQTFSFYDLWKEIWGKDCENKQYRNDYYQAKERFENLRDGYTLDGAFIQLDTLIQTTPCLWETPEWGFPKGRRNPHETDQECAIREFCEETHLSRDQLCLLTNVKPIRESFTGNNHIRYEHVYFLAWISKKSDFHIDLTDQTQVQEIGDIGWFPYKDAFSHIRDTTPEKRQVLLQAKKTLEILYPIVRESV